MADQATLSYQELAERLAGLKTQTAQAEQQLKNALKGELETRKKQLGTDPTSRSIINTHTAWAAAAGLLMGTPVVSGAAITAVQIRMLDQLALRYGQNFTENEARNTLLAITGGLITPIFAGAPVTVIASMIPLVGPIAGLLAGPALAAASTRIVGRLFVEHFEAGGKVSDLDLGKAKQDYDASVKAEADKQAGSASTKPAAASSK